MPSFRSDGRRYADTVLGKDKGLRSRMSCDSARERKSFEVKCQIRFSLSTASSSIVEKNASKSLMLFLVGESLSSMI